MPEMISDAGQLNGSVVIQTNGLETIARCSQYEREFSDGRTASIDD
jgi:hypothetical protein